MIGVVGPTGQVGGTLTRRLIADNGSVRALTRNPEKTATALQGAAVQISRLDFTDPSSLRSAVRGLDQHPQHKHSQHQHSPRRAHG